MRRWFFILILVNCFFLGLFVYEEWRPDWKRYQEEYIRERFQLLRAEVEAARPRIEEGIGGLAALRAGLEEENRRLQTTGKADQLQLLETDLAASEERLDLVRDSYQRLYSRYQLLEIRFHRKGEDDPAKGELWESLQELQRQLDTLKTEEAEIRREMSGREDRVATILGERRRLEGDIRTSESELARLEDRLAAVKREGPVIKQAMNTELGRVDRCTSCHCGMDDDQFDDHPSPLGSHHNLSHLDVFSYHPLESYGCTICHDGQGLATTLPEAHGREAHFHEPLLQGDLAQGSCHTCHSEQIRIPDTPVLMAAPLLEEGRQLFDDKGCTGCHDVTGFEHLDRTGPRLSEVADKVETDWLYRWIRRPDDYLPSTNMPDFLLSEEETRAVLEYLLLTMKAESPPTAPPRPSDPDVAYERGRALFQQSRCITCHSIESLGGTIGPDLVRVESKLQRAWLYQWLSHPAAYDPSTLMPRFRFTDPERFDLMEYIVQEFVDWELSEESKSPIRPVSWTDRARTGESLVRKFGCFGCHEMEGHVDQQKVSTDLSDFGSKTVDLLDFGWAWNVPRTRLDWTTTKLRSPRLFRETLLMPDYRLTEREIRALTAVLLALKGKPVPPAWVHSPKTPPADRFHPDFAALLDDCRCRTCHLIGIEGGTLAPSLNRIGSRFKKDYLRDFLLKPEAIRPLLVERMIRLNLSPEEIRILSDGMSFLFTDEAIPLDPIGGDAADAGRGGSLYREIYGCGGCHMIGSEGGTSGPNLSETGNRLKPGYIHAWLSDPQSLIPDAREPDYGLDDTELRDLTAYLVSLDGEVAP